MSNLLDHFAAAVARHPDRIAIVEGSGRQISFRQLQARAQHLAANWRHRGIQPGDRVLLAMRVEADLYASLAALWSLGATVVLPEPAMGLPGLRHAARTTKSKAFCTAGAFVFLKLILPELWGQRLLLPRERNGKPPDATVAGNDTALISFTSGTTGQPKAIPRSHAFLMAQHNAIAPVLHSDAQERDLVAFPVFALINLAAGRTTVLPNWKISRPDSVTPNQLSDWIRRQKVTRILVPPSLCEKLVSCADTQPLQKVFTGGGPVFPDLVDTLRTKAGLDVTCVYGSTEAEPIAHLDAAEISEEEQRQMAGGKGLLVGHPVPQIALRIQDNEIQVAGAHVNDGYLDPTHSRENKIAEGGVIWHRTGDAGTLDDLGRLWLWGRIGSDVTTHSGRIYPFAIEVAARHWPGVTRSALVAVNDHPVLCVQGQAEHLPDWRRAAQGFGVPKVVPVQHIPMDKRHASKVDRKTLLTQLRP